MLERGGGADPADSGRAGLVATMRAPARRPRWSRAGSPSSPNRSRRALGFDRVVANRLDIARGRIAGTVQPPIVTRDTKRETLLSARRRAGPRAGADLAVGDGANDLPMLEAAGIGIAFHAKPSGRRRSRAGISTTPI